MTAQSSNLPKGIWGGKIALLLGGLFVTLFALSTLLVHRDSAERSRLELLTPAPADATH